MEENYKKHNPVAEPGITQNHLWSDCCNWRVDFRCIDDGGLLSDPKPAGKKFQIVRADGVRANFRVVEKYNRTQKEYTNIFGEKCYTYNRDVFIAIGQLEDFYFSNHEPPRANMEIYVEKDGITYLYICAFRKDGKELYSLDFPRWQAYLEMKKKLHVAHRVEMQKLIDKMLYSMISPKRGEI